MTRPWRRMIRHLLQIFLTLGLTFTANFFLMGVWGAVPPHELRASPARVARIGGCGGSSPHMILRATGKLTVGQRPAWPATAVTCTGKRCDRGSGRMD